MWTDYYFKALQANLVLDALPAEWRDEEGKPLDSLDRAWSVIGEIEGTQGWHANLRLKSSMALPDLLAEFVIPRPAFPKRVFI